MLPRATHTRSDRESVKGKLGGRTQEISRLVGRSLRAVVNMRELGENTIVIDCDVLQADGGTRTAAITGAYVALADAISWAKSQGHIKADAKLAEKLAIAVGAPVLYLKRLRLADNVPVSILENYVPEDLSQLSEAELNEHGLYQMLRARGVTIRVAKQRIGARKASTTDSSLLGIEKGSALLTMDRTAYDNSGRAVEYGHHCYRPDLYSFEVTLVEK